VAAERYRVAIVRGGRLVAEWNHGAGRDEQLWPSLPHDSYAASGAGSQHILTSSPCYGTM